MPGLFGQQPTQNRGLLSGLGGALGGFFRGEPASGISRAQVLGGVMQDLGTGAGSRGTDLALMRQQGAQQTRSAEQARAEAEQRRQTALQRGYTPEIADLYAQSPEQFFSALGSNLEPQNVNAGDTLVRNDVFGGNFRAPLNPIELGEGANLVDPNNGFGTVAQGQPKTTDELREYAFAKAQGYAGTFPQYQQEIRRAGASQTNVSFGQDDFQNKLAGAEADQYVAMLQGGQAASRNLVRLQQAENLLANVETGGGAAIRQQLGEFGISSDGLSDIQAAQALINSMVPDQRPPGTGPMSDADLALYKQSLPRIINQPGGNAIIIETAKAINQYDLQLAQIAQAAASGQMTRDQARQAVASVQNPIDGFRAALGQGGGGGGGSDGGGQPRRITSDADFDALPSGAEFIDPDGVRRRKP
jgi:hypothetical protein